MGLVCAGVFLNISCRDTASQSGLPPEKTEVAPAAVKEEETVKKSAEQKKVKATFIELGSVGCMPCKMMAPIVEEIKNEYAGQVEVIFYDVWTPEGKPYGDKYKIRAIPTQVFLDSNGEEYFRHEGYFPKKEILKELKKMGVE
ncbi:thioredoxin family protein [bacterium]|nr:thioredoxin family protein [bacterium]